ncbi:hypothetical protein [Roseobacter denitrificans]|uniref:hypothetical protein n=1 Tax=Roseobacter denitrificans TaxID=2434 RepID=UPI00209B4A7F|nr:hypothetical protein [Roseobacter denitrificans]
MAQNFTLSTNQTAGRYHMPSQHWAIFALRDIQTALDCDKYDVASCHIDDAIAAILAQDEQDATGHHKDAGDMGLGAGIGS